ncbi:MAG: MFS transporter [Rhodoferax sp.]|nr:MFS transporter [Rhodoferax sp.]MBP7492410.1 MFS transporter [Rhodoferax sp.]
MDFSLLGGHRLAPFGFYASLFLSRLADQVLLFLVPLVVFQTTQSAAWSGIAFFVETLPRFMAYPVCGALCDRLPTLRLLRVSQVVRALVCAVGVAGFMVWGGIGWLVALSAVCGVLTTQGMMARETMLPHVFREGRFVTVLAKTQMADQLGMVLGPLLAALLLVWWPWQGVVFATAMLFLAADGALALWSRYCPVSWPVPNTPAGAWWQPYRTGVSHWWHLPGLFRLTVVTAGVNLVLGVTMASSAAMVTGVFRQTEHVYALLQTGGAIATVVILLAIARLNFSVNLMGSWSFGCVLVGGLIMAFGTSPWQYALGFVTVIGFDKMFSVYVRSLRQTIIPPGDYGKTTGVVIMLNNLSQPAAGLAVGLFSAKSDPSAVIATLTGVMALLGAAVWVTRRRAVV